MDERTWQANELNYKLQREVEELKQQVQELRRERQETSHRMSELELEVKTMRIVYGAQLQALGGMGVVNGGNLSQQVSAASMRQQSPYAGNLSTGSLKETSGRQQAESTPLSSRPGQGRNGQLNIKYGVLNEHENPMEVLAGEEQEVQLMEKLCLKYNRPSAATNSITTNGTGEDDQVVMQMEKDTFDLRRELQDAVAGKKSAEQRILT